MRPKGMAKLTCRICKADYEKKITKLMKEVDVYSAWIDEAEEKNKRQVQGRTLGL